MIDKQPQEKPRVVRSRSFTSLALAVCLALAVVYYAAQRNTDPKAKMLRDVFGLIDEFYLVATDREQLMDDAFTGMARVLIPTPEIKSAALTTGAAGEKSDDANKTDDDTAGEKTEEQGTTLNEISLLNMMKELKEKDASGNDPDLSASPLSVEAQDHRIKLGIDDQAVTLALADDRNEAVKSFMQGYHFVAQNTGGDADGNLFYKSLEYMTGKLDPHSGFLPPKQYDDIQAETQGHFGGVGIEVGMRGDLLTVIAPIEGTPAFKAKIMPMDRIVAVDGKTTVGLSLFEAVEMIRGEIGTKVTLTIRRAGIDDFSVELVRSDIPVNTIKLTPRKNGVAWLRIYSFNQSTAGDMKEALKAHEEKNGDIRALIMDLRYNPGGLLDQAVEVADKFLESGMIVNTIGRGRLQETESFAASPGTRALLPVIVLVNNGSASASEIVAGALQDHKRALVMGTRTFGKGSVQSIFRLPGNAGLRLTTALYYTPSGRSIQASGIMPDIYIRFPELEEQLASLHSESSFTGIIKSDMNVKEEPEVEIPGKLIHDSYKKAGKIVEDEFNPEKEDWLLVFAEEILAGKDLSYSGMVKRAKQLYGSMK